MLPTQLDPEQKSWNVLRMAQILVCTAILLSSAAFCLAQRAVANADTPADATTLSVDVKVVNLLVTVRDKHGKIVSDLDKSDFTLEEDGHAAAIQYFSRESDLPLTLGLLVDTSLSQRTVLDQEKSASKAFF